MSRLTDRQRRFLQVLRDAEGPLSPVRIHKLAYPNDPYKGRRDAGATRTLDSLQNLGLARGTYGSVRSTGRTWVITTGGRVAI